MSINRYQVLLKLIFIDQLTINSKLTILIRPHTTTATDTSTNNIVTDATDAPHHFTFFVDRIVSPAKNSEIDNRKFKIVRPKSPY